MERLQNGPDFNPRGLYGRQAVDRLAAELDDIPRWTHTNLRQSVKGHTLGMFGLLAYTAHKFPQLPVQVDTKKTVPWQILIHDTPEIVVGDLPWGIPDHENKYALHKLRERRAFHLFIYVSPLPREEKEFFLNIFDRIDKREIDDRESLFVNWLDKAEAILFAKRHRRLDILTPKATEFGRDLGKKFVSSLDEPLRTQITPFIHSTTAF